MNKPRNAGLRLGLRGLHQPNLGDTMMLEHSLQGDRVHNTKCIYMGQYEAMCAQKITGLDRNGTWGYVER